jgi:hypothetical protein
MDLSKSFLNFKIVFVVYPTFMVYISKNVIEIKKNYKGMCVGSG